MLCSLLDMQTHHLWVHFSKNTLFLYFYIFFTHDWWHLTPDMWNITHDIWHVLKDTQGVVYIVSTFQFLSSSGLEVKVHQVFCGKGSLNQSVNDKGVFGTASATPGLVIYIYSLTVLWCSDADPLLYLLWPITSSQDKLVTSGSF